MSLPRAWIAAVAALLLAVVAAPAAAGSLSFVSNGAGSYEYGRQLSIPAGFGAAEFTMELWIRPTPGPVGPTTDGTAGQRTNWSSADRAPYGSADWWYEGNFLLDGHNNGTFAEGTFSLQLYGGGRLRWLLGDGESAGPGGVWSVGAHPASASPSLLDGGWHRVVLVRRFAAAPGALLELWIDGALVDTQTTPSRPDLRAFWSGWSGFPAPQAGWFWGAEKQAAIGVLTQYEDYKGLVDEIRFWSRARTPAEIAAGGAPSASEPGLVGAYSFGEGAGTSACRSSDPAGCISLVNWSAGRWSAEDAPLASPPPPTPPPPVPGAAPRLGALTLSRARIRPGTATTVRFSLSAPARVTLVLERLVPGRRRGVRCVPGARVGRACARPVRRATIARTLPAGRRARMTVPGRPAGRVLIRGRYRLTVTARDPAGRSSRTRRAVLTVRCAATGNVCPVAGRR